MYIYTHFGFCLKVELPTRLPQKLNSLHVTDKKYLCDRLATTMADPELKSLHVTDKPACGRHERDPS